MADLAESIRGLDRSAVLTFVDQMFGLRPADDDPTPIGPWGPIMRGILIGAPVPDPWRRDFSFGPSPQPWGLKRDFVFGPLPDPWGQIGGFAVNPLLKFLNPQPLPPLPAMMLEALIARAEFIADVGKAIGNDDAAVDFVRMMVDDLCPPPWRFPIPSWPKGGDGERPPRPNELVLDAAGLIVLGAGLRSAAAWTAHASLATVFVEVGLRGIDVGVGALPDRPA